MFFRAGLWTGKAAGATSQLIGMNGTSIPGMVGQALDWNMLHRLSRQVKNIIAITGTNGKTTVSNLLSSVYEETGNDFVNNLAGSNLITGITSSFMEKTNLLGYIQDCDTAIIEVDEATLIKVLKKLTPSAILITNFFRDQLDRYGEIDTLIKKMEEAIRPIDTKLILNADDPFSYRFSLLGKETSYFGLNENAYTFEQSQMNDSKFCTCGKLLEYNFVHYGQLGDFYCSCGVKRKDLDFGVEKIHSDEFVSIDYKGKRYESKLKGAYNAYNLMATIALAKELNIPDLIIQNGLKKFLPGNGRMQTFRCGEFPYLLNLAKNPQGTNSTMNAFLQNENDKRFVLVLNDLEADGTDVSWIWDADYELLNRPDVKEIVCVGRRAYDMAIRIKYTGYPVKQIKIIPGIPEVVNHVADKQMETYFITNYTSLEFLRETIEENDKITLC